MTCPNARPVADLARLVLASLTFIHTKSLCYRDSSVCNEQWNDFLADGVLPWFFLCVVDYFTPSRRDVKGSVDIWHIVLDPLE